MSLLPTVTIGEAGPEVPIIGYGTYHLPDKLDAIEALGSLEAAVQAGVTLFDLSDNYGTELLLGRVLADEALARDEIFIATKTGLARSYSETVRWQAEGKGQDTSPNRIVEQLGRSLYLLGTKSVDLYQLHVEDPNIEAADHAVVMTELVETGKIAAYGVSNYGVAALEDLLNACDQYELVQPSTLQPAMNMLTSFGKDNAIELAKQSGMTVLAHSPLLKGALTDSAVSLLLEATSGPNTQPELKVMVRHLDDLKAYANEQGRTLSELALAWLAMQDQTVVLSACTTPNYLAEAVGAAHQGIEEEGLEMIESIREDPNIDSFASWLLRAMREMRAYYR
jgi:aryl-alcohol dehydrogenase-like predicted oxidoreductase